MTARRKPKVTGAVCDAIPVFQDPQPDPVDLAAGMPESPDTEFAPKGPTMSLPEAHALILKELRFIERLKGISCLPEDHWPKQAIRLLRGHLGRTPTVEEVMDTLEIYRVSMRVHRIRLARSVQPTGDPRLLAPIVGAIRLNDIGVDHAVQFLLNHVLKTIREHNGFTFADLQNFSKEPLGTHRHYQIWIAIDEMMNQNSEVMGTPSGSEQLTIATIPWSDQVKSYIEEKQKAGRFQNIPMDGKTWTRLWTESGAGMIIAKSNTKTTYKPFIQAMLDQENKP